VCHKWCLTCYCRRVCHKKKQKENRSPTRAKNESEIRSGTGFSSVKTAENRNFAWNEAWEKANIAINAGK